jgi:uroporphyrin-III C-methyltransferase
MSAAGGLPSFLPSFLPGTVWLAGAGPGDPGLLTLHAAHGLAEAEVVLHDALVAPEILALAGPRARLVPVGKRARGGGTAQLHINQRLIALARAGQRVLRLKGGDPLLFGRGSEEALALAAAGVPFRIIPGMTSGLAGLAGAGIPATMRGVNKAVILATGHGAGLQDELDWQALARTGQPIVVYMGMRNLARIAAALMEGGLAPSTPAAVIAAASTAAERILTSTLERLAVEVEAQGIGAPALIVVGGIVALHAELAPFMQAGRTPS